MTVPIYHRLVEYFDKSNEWQIGNNGTGNSGCFLLWRCVTDFTQIELILSYLSGDWYSNYNTMVVALQLTYTFISRLWSHSYVWGTYIEVLFTLTWELSLKKEKKTILFYVICCHFSAFFFWGETSIFKKCQIAQVLVQNHATRKPAASVRFPSRFLPCRTLENPAGLLQIQPVPFVSGSMKTNRSPTNASTSSASPASWNGRRYVGRSSWLLQSNLNCCRVLHSGQARMPAMQARVQLHTSQHPFEWRLWRVQNRNHGAGRTRPLGPGSRPQQIPLQVRQAQYRPQGPSQSSEHVVVGGQDDPHSRQAQAPGVAAAHTDAGFRERNTPNNPDQTEKGEANRDQ